MKKDEKKIYKIFLPAHEFPWAALLLYESKSSNLTLNACGGALIHRKYILTAGEIFIILSHFFE